MLKAASRTVVANMVLLVLAATMVPWISKAACNAQDGTLVTVTIGKIDRVPIFGKDPQKANQKSITVTLSPSPLPAGAVVTLTLSTSSGNGSATFDDGSTSKRITQTTTVNIRGVANSSAQNNIELDASINNHFSSTCASINFTVSTWPYGFQMVTSSTHTADDFGFWNNWTWTSESGNLDDLSNIELREYITAAATVPNPPFHEKPASGDGGYISGSAGTQLDTHDYPQSEVDGNNNASYSNLQEIQFLDPVFDPKGWGTTVGTGSLADYTYTRTVAPDPNNSGSSHCIFTTSGTGQDTQAPAYQYSYSTTETAH
jgi:hypothetical protein